MKRLCFAHGALMPLQKLQHSGRVQITGKPMDCLPVQEFCSIMNHRCAWKGLLREKLSLQHAVLPSEAGRGFG